MGNESREMYLKTWHQDLFSWKSRDPSTHAVYLFAYDKDLRSWVKQNRRVGPNSIKLLLLERRLSSELMSMWRMELGFAYFTFDFRNYEKTTPLLASHFFFLVGSFGFPGLTGTKGVEFSYSLDTGKSWFWRFYFWQWNRGIRRCSFTG